MWYSVHSSEHKHSMAIPLYSHEKLNTSTHVYRDTHKCRAKTILHITHTHIHSIRALHTKEQHEIFSEFFNMCSIPPAHVEVQKKRERDRKEETGGGDGVNECNGRARARERKSSWLFSKQLPLATALAQSVPYWPADSPHHNPMQDNQPMRCRNGAEL